MATITGKAIITFERQELEIEPKEDISTESEGVFTATVQALEDDHDEIIKKIYNELRGSK